MSEITPDDVDDYATICQMIEVNIENILSQNNFDVQLICMANFDMATLMVLSAGCPKDVFMKHCDSLYDKFKDKYGKR